MRAVDLAYHVRAGELMLRSGQVLRHDTFTFTMDGQPWFNQQWAGQVVFAGAHRVLGWTGVVIAHAAAIGGGFALLYRACRRAGTSALAAALLTLLGFVAGSGSLAARPQALAIPLFTGTWLLLTRRDAWTWLVPLLTVIWANVHGSFLLAPILAAFALGDDLIARRSARRGTLILAATVLATFVTPFGPSVWSYAVGIAGNETIRNSVAEWRPPALVSLSGAPFWMSGVAVAVAAISRRRTVRPLDVARLLLFFALGVPALRATLWWALVAPPVVARWYPAHEATHRQERRRDPLTVTTATVIVALLPIALFLRSGTDPVTRAPVVLARDAPEILVDATRRVLPGGSRLFVFQPFASWFEYSLPEDPVMVDSRIELFSDAIWRDYKALLRAGPGWEMILDRHRIQGVILPPAEDEDLTEALSAAPGWRVVEDGPAG
ncbi:MAG: hypothetical protein ACRELC_01870, partial [Gemmatimonadota bacterium]